MNPRDLPIYDVADELRAKVAANPVVVVESPPGSGKTTQIPQILDRAGLTDYGVLGVTQPRRIAAVSVATRIAHEMGCPLGEDVGYKMRFSDLTGPNTRVKIMTDGILLQEMRLDPLLSRYALIMVDEAHERSLNIDFICGLLKRVLQQRTDLRVVISSATLNAEAFCRYFDDAPLLSLDVRPYPVEVDYLRAPLDWRSDLAEETANQVMRLMREGAEGDVLVFLPGEAAIVACAEKLREYRREPLEVLTLFGRMPKEDQDRVFDEFPGKRKIVIATNIAETSITIDGIRVVVDCGFAKIKSFNHDTGIGALIEQPISRASCDQRTGRAGRTAPGRAVRLYTERSYEERDEFAEEEIRRTDLSEVVLRMLSLGIREVERFDFLAPPDAEAVHGALEILYRIGAITETRELTDVGRLMLEFPLDPRIGRMVVEAALNATDVATEVITVASFLSARHPFAFVEGEEAQSRASHRRFHDERGDFHTYLNMFEAFQRARDPERFCEERYLDYRAMSEVANIRRQLLDLVQAAGYETGSGGHWSKVIQTVASGLVQLICVRDHKGQGYRSPAARGVFLHPGSALFHHQTDCFVAAEIVRTKRTFARSAARMEPQWIADVAPEIHAALFGRGRRVRPEPARQEVPQSVRLGDNTYRIQKNRGQLTISVPWKELKSLPAPSYLAPEIRSLDLRGQVLHDEGVVLRGVKLQRLLEAAPRLAALPGKGRPLNRWPKDDFFVLPDDLHRLKRHLPSLLRIVRRGGRRRTLGFLTLCANGNGGYWLDATHDPRDGAVTASAAVDDAVRVLREAGMDDDALLFEERGEALEQWLPDNG